MSEQIKVSIVIPFYNNPEFLNEQIVSILNQSYKKWELLLIDDGADIESLKCAKSYEEADERIKIIERHRLPKGAQTCRNIGLQHAIGKFICFFDSDDIVLPHCLENRVKYMEKNEKIDFGVFKAETFDKSGQIPIQTFGTKATSDDMKFFINGILPFAVWTNIYRRKSLLRCQAIWDENILSLQDAAYNIQNISVKNLKYSYYPGNETDYLWRINHNANSITKNIQSKKYNKSHIYFLKTIINHIRTAYGNKYDPDIALRIHYFGLKFVSNEDIESLILLKQLSREKKIQMADINRYKIYYHLIKKIHNDTINKIIKYLIFPKLSYYNRCNVINFSESTKTFGSNFPKVS